MSTCPDIKFALGQWGQSRHTVLSQIVAGDIINGTIATGDCIHSGTLTLACAAEFEGRTGVYESIFIRVLNGTTAAVLPEVTAYVFREDITNTVPVSGDELIMTAAEWGTLVDDFDVPVAVGIPGVDPANTYRSKASSRGIELEYQCASNDNTLYVVLINKGASITFANDATIEVEHKLRLD